MLDFGNLTANFILNETACENVDRIFVTLIDMKNEEVSQWDNHSGLALPIVILCLSLFMLVFGGKLFRISAALAAALFGFWATYSFFRTSASGVSCEASLVVGGVVGLVAGVSTGCMLKLGLFFVGAAAFAAAVHLIFSAFPTLHTIADQPTLAEKSLAYWALLLLAAVAGGLTLRWNSEVVLEIATALIGGASFAYSLHSISDTTNMAVENWVFMTSGVVASFVGILLQRHLRLNGCRCKQRGTDPHS